MKHLYTAHATAQAGREGHVETDDGKISFDLSRPGGEGQGTNPEQLFACGYAACFGGAVQAVARKQKLNVGAVEVHAEVSLHQDEEGGYFLAATLDVQLPTLEEKAGIELVETAHGVCPYSKATRGNIKVTLKINGKNIS